MKLGWMLEDDNLTTKGDEIVSWCVDLILYGVLICCGIDPCSDVDILPISIYSARVDNLLKKCKNFITIRIKHKFCRISIPFIGRSSWSYNAIYSIYVDYCLLWVASSILLASLSDIIMNVTSRTLKEEVPWGLATNWKETDVTLLMIDENCRMFAVDIWNPEMV